MKALNKISVKLLFAILVMTVIISTTIGVVNYTFAKKELIESGKLDLQHLVNTSMATLEALNNAVKEGSLTLEEAQEKAREILNGPKVDNGKEIYNFSQSPFVYKKNGYIFALKSNREVSLNPLTPIGTNDTSKTAVETREHLIKAAQAEKAKDHFMYMIGKIQVKIQLVKKISYMTYFEPWDWNIGIGAYTDEFYDSLHIMKWLTIILCVGISVICLAIFYTVARKKFRLLEKNLRCFFGNC